MFNFYFFYFYFGKVTRKSCPDGGMEAMGDLLRPHGFFILRAIGAALWLFLFLSD